jgi:hypothetical protein
VRCFVATREQEHFVIPHTHRYDFAAYVLQGSVDQILYEKSPAGEWYAISDVERGAEPQQPHTEARFTRRQRVYNTGEWYAMLAKEFHSIKFSRDATVLILEGAEESEFSQILEPVVGGKHLRTFHRADWMQK